MHGGIDNREALIQKKAKNSSDLDALRNEVKSLETKLQGATTKKAARSSLAHRSGAAALSQREAQRARDSANVSAVCSPWHHAGALAPTTLSSLSSSSSSGDDPYSYADALKRRRKKCPQLPDPLAEEEKLKQQRLDGELPPLPMVADNIFRDGMLSVLIGEGWSADQALAALVATQTKGTLSAAKKWLRETLVTGNMMTGVSPKKRTTQSALEKLVQEETVHTGGEGSNLSDFKDPPLPPVRRSMMMMATQNQNPSSRTGPSPLVSAEALMMENKKQNEEMQDELRGGNTPAALTTVARQLAVMPTTTPSSTVLMSTTASASVMTPSPNYPSLSSVNSSAVVATPRSQLPSIRQTTISAYRDDRETTATKLYEKNVRIKIRRPTDGARIELRRNFCLNDLLSAVLSTFLEEQGEDATSGASKAASEAAASFARMMSASASRWSLVATAPPKLAYNWKEMDRTTLKDAGVTSFGTMFTLQRR